ncbi:hypothetical protein CHS0354_038593 [Potamilus streckersoni]|uniref:Uncharacterized protein n=1 Tax=Potamilus streckersoni TaxID=2493646 RepID=A0AAE0TGS4_9BIVA|nr:hypothetical protein CHS0354_038593 [Potamilus streckersoni]
MRHEQLDEIRTTTLSKVICRNTGLTSIPSKAFRINGNPTLSCSGVSDIDYNKWKCGWSIWESWTQCVNFLRFRLRTCRRHKPCAANICTGNAFQVEACGFLTRANIPRIRFNIRSFELLLSQQQNINGTVNLSDAQNALRNLATH